MRGLMMDDQLLLSSLLWRTERLYPNKEIITRRKDGSYHRYTYADYGRRVRRLADALIKMGVRPGEKAGILAWNNYRHFELVFGVPSIGAVTHGVNMRLFPEQQAYMINHAGDEVIFLDEDQVPLVEELAKIGIPTVKAFIIMTDGPLPETNFGPTYSYEELLADADETFELPEFDERSAAAMCYTSATTGLPKGVVYSHRAMVLQILTAAGHDQIGMSESSVWMSIAPLFHANGWLTPHTLLHQGATIVFPGDHPAPIDYLACIEDLRVTGLNGVVTIGNMMRDLVSASDRPWDLHSLRKMWLGGQAAPRAIMEWWRDTYGTEVVQGYGMTETTPSVCFWNLKSNLRDKTPDEVMALRTQAGLPLPLLKIRIVDSDGAELPWDGTSVGEIHLRGPWVASAYLDDDRSSTTMVDGWFHTGDVGVITAEGYVIIRDRTKDLIKSGGEWISSIDVENALMSHPDVLEATVISVPDPKWEERPIACVAPVPGAQLTEDALRAFLKDKIARWWIPDRFIFIQEVPRTVVGKYDKKRVRSIINGGGVEAIEAELGSAYASTNP